MVLQQLTYAQNIVLNRIEKKMSMSESNTDYSHTDYYSEYYDTDYNDCHGDYYDADAS